MPTTRQEAGHAANAHGEPGCFRDTAAPGSSRTGRGCGGRVLGRHTHSHNFGDNSRAFGDHTDRVRYGMELAQAVGCHGVWHRGKACHSFTPFSGRTLSEHRYVHYPQAQ